MRYIISVILDDMRWNPFVNALGAVAYIGVVALFIHFISSIRHDTPDTILDSVGFLSLVVCSAAMMAFLFFYRPAMLLIENKKSEALVFFFKTLGAFAAITVIALILVSAQ